MKRDANDVLRQDGVARLREVIDAGGAAPVTPRPIAFINPAQWHGQDVPRRKWLVPHRIPLANVTMVSGDGASGKTTIALQLVVATVRGTDWLGSMVDHPGPAVFMTAEEDEDELHRRLDAIAMHTKTDLRDLDQLHLLPLPSQDPVLGAPDKAGLIAPTPLFESLLSTCTKLRPSLIAIEAAADVFAGNENDRTQVRAFIGLLRRLAIASGAAVLLVTHPSLTGLTSGTGTSGSTAWNNSVRSRLYFAGAKPRDGDETDSDVRELKVMKSNYGPPGEVVRLRWQSGVFVPEGGIAPVQQAAAEADADRTYLDCLDAATGQGMVAYPLPGRGYAPKMFAGMPQACGLSWRALDAAQRRLLASGRIWAEPFGPPSRGARRIARKGLDPLAAEAAE
jgi:RecA-family ATPase